MPFHEDGVSRRKGEILGNRVPGLNRPKALPTEGLGMVSKSHFTVKPVARDSGLDSKELIDLTGMGKPAAARVRAAPAFLLETLTSNICTTTQKTSSSLPT